MKLKATRPTNKDAIMVREFSTIIIFQTIFSIFIALAFKPPTKEEQMDKYNKMNQEVEPFRKNLTECAREVRASMVDVENFLKRIPQSTMQGKCFVACILKRNNIIKKNKISEENLLEVNRAVYGDDEEVMFRLKSAIEECYRAVDVIFEICDYASVFNDCMHLKMEHILDKVTMERRMEALGQMTSDPDVWTDDEDEILKLVKDEL
ncbi:jg6655 [Pararge aegeria aegeria]|uniref:Jg6655 protein n=1 Tax=Pararge aegeria aegeria TaxID=348720 RepID=A0A8S4S0F8_9NEOP|nr:jg6655 [Pararge aegeria aegeria]